MKGKKILDEEIRTIKCEQFSCSLRVVMCLCACSCIMEFAFFSEIILLVPDYCNGGTD